LVSLLPFSLCALEYPKGTTIKGAIHEILHGNWDIEPKEAIMPNPFELSFVGLLAPIRRCK